jgi:hypothetical protein
MKLFTSLFLEVGAQSGEKRLEEGHKAKVSELSTVMHTMKIGQAGYRKKD